MPEIKHTFTAGKMDKDLDERLVRNGEYRDALNVQVRTTSGDGSGVGEAGTVQNIEGNEQIGSAYLTKGYDYGSNNNITKFVGSIADEKTDKAYFLAAAPLKEGKSLSELVNPISGLNKISESQIDIADYATSAFLDGFDIEGNFNPNNVHAHAVIQNLYLQSIDKTPLKCWIDSIIEVDAKNETHGNIFIDKFAITARLIDIIPDPTNLQGWAGDSSTNDGVVSLLVQDGSDYRVGMIVRLYNNDNQDLFFANGTDASDGVGVEIVAINNNNLMLATPQQVDLANLLTVNQQDQQQNISLIQTELSFKSAITFIHPERVLQFNYNKIITGLNILDELLFYTDGVNEPKKLNIERCKAGTDSNPDGIPAHTKLFVFDNEPGDPDLVDVTTMEWDLQNSDIKREHITVIRRAPVTPPTLIMKNTDRSGSTSFNLLHNFIVVSGDINSVPQSGQQTVITLDSNYDLREGDVLILTSSNNSLDPVVITVRIVEIIGDTVQGNIIIEFLFVDDELPVYNPQEWDVELQLPKALFETKFGRVGYRYKYEDGECSSFSPWSELAFLPQDFSYTPSLGFNNGMENSLRSLTIKDFIPDETYRPNDVSVVELLWKTTDDQNVYIIKSITRGRSGEWKNFEQGMNENYGETILTSEMITKVLSSDQLLRTWDNVPISATAQEITANRLVYGNYKQGYKISKDVSLIQNVISDVVPFPLPRKSVKSIRNYKWGVVLGDRYGRETSVLVDGYESGTNTIVTGDINIEKSLSSFSNKFKLRQQWGTLNNPGIEILKWAEYAKYYVKETTNEYYNLVLDRWYDSGDGNIWLSFPSVDRNKVDEETYLILKNGHGSQTAIGEKARYKILAISGEAPDFIKTQRKTFARVEIDTLGIYGVEEGNDITDGIPRGLVNKTSIMTDSADWNGLGNPAIRGTARVRIIGRLDASVYNGLEVKSKFVEVSRVNNSGATRKGVDIAEKFKLADVFMPELFDPILSGGGLPALDVGLVDGQGGDGDVTDTSVNPNYIKYFMEIVDDVVENRPQFDGRFFVKINKDAVLEQQVLNIGTGGVDFIPDGSPFNIAYIANEITNPATVGLYNGNNWDSYGTGSFTNATIAAVTDPFDISSLLQSGDGGPLNSSHNDWGYYSSDAIASISSTNNWWDSYWGYINWADEWNRVAQPIPRFGPHDPLETEEFWNNWYNEEIDLENDSEKEATIFLDQAPVYDGFNFRGRVTASANLSEDGYLGYEEGDQPFWPDVLGGLGFEISHYYIGHKWRYENTENESYRTSTSSIFAPLTCLPVGATDNVRNNMIGYLPAFFTLHTSNYGDTEGGVNMNGNFEMRHNYKPFGLDGPFTGDDTKNMMVFSVIGHHGNFGSDPAVSDFYEKMLVPNNYFRFPNDINNNVYKIVSNSCAVGNYYAGGIQSGTNIGYVNVEFNDFRGPVTIDSINYRSDDEEDEVRKRHSIVVTFERVVNGLGVPNSGINIDNYDPRGEAKHNGRRSFQIQFMQPVGSGELSEDETLSQGAIFETEPKEDVDLDIYYEASEAIPMVLKKNNIKSYVSCGTTPGNAATVRIENRITEDGNIAPVQFGQGDSMVSVTYGDITYPTSQGYDLEGEPFVYTAVSNNYINIKIAASNSNTPIHYIDFAHGQSVTGGNDWFFNDGPQIIDCNGIAIGDTISFDYSNKAITRTKILDHVVPVNINDGFTGPGLGEYPGWSADLLSGLLDSSTTFNLQGVYLTAQNFVYDGYASCVPSNRVTLQPTDPDVIPSSTSTNDLNSDGISDEQVLLYALSPSMFSKLRHGMQVTGVTVPSGTFVVNIDDETSNLGDSIENVVIGADSDWYFIKITLNNKLLNNFNFFTNSLTFIETTGWYEIDTEVFKYAIDLKWFNCYSFGNGLESDRIRDDFNAPQIDNGVKVSSTFLEYGEEKISSGLIHSSELYNNTSSVNGLNEFSMAQKITKNLNPIYGSIQALKTRDTDVVVFAEDKILKVLANKDAVFNADGNTQLTATNRVLGQTIPFVGDYGISKNPESLAADNYRIYFTDRQRGAVMRLSRDGLTPISNVGMKSYFRDYLRMCENIVGTFDVVSGEYNIKLGINEINQNETICNENGCTVIAEPTTVSFNEAAKSWVSFKSFKHNCGVSVTGKYITAPTGAHALTNAIWKHNSKQTARNSFYGENFPSSIDILFNDQSDSIKSFKSLNYEGSDSYIVEDLNDNNYYNIKSRPGWKVQDISTDLQSGKISEFIKKESKYFNYITSGEVNASNIDTSNLDIQGIGYALQIGETTASSTTFETSVNTGGDGTINSGGTNIDTDPTDADTEITIEDEDGNVNETGEEVSTVSQLPQFDEVVVVPAINDQGITVYSILAKVSGGSGNYSFVLVASHGGPATQDFNVIGPDPFPTGNQYTPVYSGPGSEFQNTWATWPQVVDGSNPIIIGNAVSLDHDWSYNEYQFASHTQFPTGLQNYPIINGVQYYNQLHYSILVLDNENTATSYDVQGVTVDVGYNFYPDLSVSENNPFYGSEISYPFLGQPFYYSNIILNEQTPESTIIPNFPAEDPGVQITSFDFEIVEDGEIQTGTETIGDLFPIVVPVFQTSYAIFITEINGLSGSDMIEFIQNNNITATLLDGTPEGNTATVNFTNFTGFFVIGSETPILDTNPNVTGGGANTTDFNLVVAQQSNASGGMSQGVVINSNIEYTSFQTYVQSQIL